MATDIEIPTHLNMRIDPKVRYLADLAARAKGISLSEYIEWALTESFRNVYPQEQPDDLGESLEERTARLTPPINSLAHYADALWSENPGVRLAIRYGTLDHLMNETDKVIFDYILRHKDLAPGGKPNQRAIYERWEEIRDAALTEDINKRKAKNKAAK